MNHADRNALACIKRGVGVFIADLAGGIAAALMVGFTVLIAWALATLFGWDSDGIGAAGIIGFVVVAAGLGLPSYLYIAGRSSIWLHEHQW